MYEKNGVNLTLQYERQSDAVLMVTLTACNSTDSDISSFSLQAAVPKVWSSELGINDNKNHSKIIRLFVNQTVGQRFKSPTMTTTQTSF